MTWCNILVCQTNGYPKFYYRFSFGHCLKRSFMPLGNVLGHYNPCLFSLIIEPIAGFCRFYRNKNRICLIYQKSQFGCHCKPSFSGGSGFFQYTMAPIVLQYGYSEKLPKLTLVSLVGSTVLLSMLLLRIIVLHCSSPLPFNTFPLCASSRFLLRVIRCICQWGVPFVSLFYVSNPDLSFASYSFGRLWIPLLHPSALPQYGIHSVPAGYRLSARCASAMCRLSRYTQYVGCLSTVALVTFSGIPSKKSY